MATKKIKLSDKQKMVVSGMRGGKSLLVRFGIRGNTTEYDGKKLSAHTFESLKDREIIEFDKIQLGGMTKHHYKLTKLGKEIEL